MSAPKDVCSRCGNDFDPADKNDMCKKHSTEHQRMNHLQKCDNCHKNYPLFSAYQDGCQPTKHRAAEQSNIGMQGPSQTYQMPMQYQQQQQQMQMQAPSHQMQAAQIMQTPSFAQHPSKK